MFELPEYINLAGQMNQYLLRKKIKTGNLGNSPHKFVWYNRSNAEFTALVTGKQVGEAFVRGRWLFIPLDEELILLLGECGGKMLYHPAGAKLPAKYHLFIHFEDDSFFTATTQMWGAMELHEKDKVWEREYIKGMRPTPVDAAFTLDYFLNLMNEITLKKKYSAKALLTQEQLIPGLGNASAQDILFNAGLDPRCDLSVLDCSSREKFYTAILETVQAITIAGGRNDEVNLLGENGGYVRLMDKNALGAPCPRCGESIQKISYLGGACYFCAHCQTNASITEN